MSLTTSSRRKYATAVLAAVAALAVAISGFVVGYLAHHDGTNSFQNTAATYPNPSNTGVPSGRAITAYVGPMTIRTCGVVIDSKIVTGDLTILASNGTHSASTPCITIRNSRVKGIIDDKWTSYSCAGFSGCGPVVIIDSEIANPTARDVAAISDTNYYMWRTYVHGARSGGQCDGYCEVHDSYLLADTESGNAHMDAFITNGNYGAPIVLEHNTFLCAPTGAVPNGAGCAANVGLFGDFSAVTNTTVTNNLFRATDDAYYCLHSGYEPGKPYPNGGRLTFTGNIFERGSSGKCGGANPVFNWNNSAGTWCNNVWDTDGTNVLPGNTDNCGSAPPTTVTTTTRPVTATSGSTPSSVPAPTTTTTNAPPPPTTTTTTTAPVVDANLTELRRIRDSLNRYLIAHGG
jgi:hypothetical protein